MTRTAEHEPLGAEALLEHVTDGVERGVVIAGDDEGGKGAVASSSSGIRASQGSRSAISVRAPCSSSGGRGDGSAADEPTKPRKPRRNASGSPVGPSRHQRSPPATNASTAGSPRATSNAGGSITVNERIASGRRAAASRQITPP